MCECTEIMCLSLGRSLVNLYVTAVQACAVILIGSCTYSCPFERRSYIRLGVDTLTPDLTGTDEVLCEFSLKTDVLLDEVQAGGRIPLIIGYGSHCIRFASVGRRYRSYCSGAHSGALIVFPVLAMCETEIHVGVCVGFPLEVSTSCPATECVPLLMHSSISPLEAWHFVWL